MTNLPTNQLHGVGPASPDAIDGKLDQVSVITSLLRWAGVVTRPLRNYANMSNYPASSTSSTSRG